ncbi:amidohydrolase family protein [Dactylosporangium sp. CA-092794]|uniref:amidohydrolase family protein n=1 Tax=Dactylosporangium sp. CA-092794 TaxID=3239929 RepID=UPI003D8BD123
MTALAERYRVIDTDTHVIEPVDLWTSRVSSTRKDDVPHVEFDPTWNVQRWRLGDRWLNPVGYYSAAGWPEHVPSYPPTLDEANPAGHNAHERLKIMDEYGLYAQVLYPNIIGFESQMFADMQDQRLALECVRAYNDFLTDFASADPKRLLPITMLPFWDVDATVQEMTRCREAGHAGALWAAKLHVLGYPRINNRHWDRVYAAAQDLEVSLNLHIGLGAFTNDDMAFMSLNRENFHVGAYVVDSAVSFSSNMHTIGTLLVSDVFERFPRLQVVSVESGFGYVPYLLESLDWQWKNSAGPTKYPSRRLPSEKFFDNVWATFWFENQTLRLLESLPQYADRLMFETDFPHTTSLSPGPASSSPRPSELIEQSVGNLDPAIAKKILQDNARRLYHIK